MNTLFDSLPLGAAFLPLGIYLLVLGWVHLRRRPLAIAGVWDGILLGASLLGLVTVGPIALVRPAAGGSSWSWPMLILGFCLVVALCVLVSRPRLIVYNISVEQIRPLVAEVASDLDPQARWAGETVALPTRGLQVHLDGDGSLRTVSLIGVGRRSAHEGWSEFSRRVRQASRRLPVRASPWGGVFAGIGAVLVLLAFWSIAAALYDRRAPLEPTLAPAPQAVHFGQRPPSVQP
ncbi:MAG: hypothetical protein DWI05_05230 [Planctomycetota bacterium]|jgi:hypothetical protein|nr:MAG: hypothetical protein DWI05_05230 [Planctomycetota bacterium]